MARFFNFLAGLLCGALVGATLVLLFAPQSGDELQASVSRRLKTVVEEGRRAAAERRAELEAQFAQAKRVSQSA